MKKLHNNSIVGERGVNLIEKTFLQMGQIWRPTSKLDTGIDGSLELRDVTTGEVSNIHVQIQSKASEGAFESETEGGFVFRVSRNDLEYWMRGNMPVLLVVSRPSSEEIYWISVKDYFKEEKSLASGKVLFDKKSHALNVSALPALWSLGAPQAVGSYQAPIPIGEELTSNLLRVSQLPRRLYLAKSSISSPKEFSNALREQGQFTREWALSGGQLLTVDDPREYPFGSLCDSGTIEDFDVTTWSKSRDPQMLRDFVQLLNGCLRARLDKDRIWFQAKHPFRLFYFAAPEDFTPRIYAYQSAKHRARREVFRSYYRKDGSLRYHRHSAVKAQFHRFEDAWYLELNPTYYFTYLEGRPSKFYEDSLSGIKRLERNNAVRGQLLMWAEVLKSPDDLFVTDYEHLKFDCLLNFKAPVMIHDEAWKPHDEFDNLGGDASGIVDAPTLLPMETHET